jgi:Ran GTPase-activating protein (RanGAP) involved in mRNA processing and transport
VADVIKINTVLQVLDLGDNGLGAEGARAVADGIKINTVLRVLDLDNNGLCQEVLSEVEQALQANKAKAREEAERRVRNNDLAWTPLTLCAAHNVRGVGSMNAV